jgi:cytochrome oxidase Cu insertion factor (SCO1/SenC/PrrC family)
VSLRSFRGRVVILAFDDSERTTVCPLTTTAMVDAKAMLGPASSRVQLLGIDANPACGEQRNENPR